MNFHAAFSDFDDNERLRDGNSIKMKLERSGRFNFAICEWPK
jgi:hypothetical protein